jgi:hypothetical protein
VDLPKDPEKAQLAAIFRKKPQHRDPFIHTSLRDSETDEKQRKRTGGVDGSNQKAYWGVSMGAGLLVGGGVTWGMITEDCHNAEADELQSRAGELLAAFARKSRLRLT